MNCNLSYELIKLDKDIGNALKKMRFNNDMTIKNATEQNNLSQNSICWWENNKVVPQTDNFVKLADFYGYDIILRKRK